MINVFQPSLGKEEMESIERVFASNWLGKGKLNTQFEYEFSKYLDIDIPHIRSTNSCSEGLFSSMQIFDIEAEDEVIMPTISFVGAGNAVCANKSKLVLCDVDPHSLNARAKDIEKKITSKTKAIILLHYAGVPCDMDEIMQLADSNNIKVIEDSACSVASKYNGQACGTIGDMGVWSFDAMKILVCGDGGAIYLKDRERAEYTEKLMYFGLESKSGYSNSVDSKWWEYDLSQYGHRSIMNDVTAAMALEQLKKVPRFIERRKEIYELYEEQLKDVLWIELPPSVSPKCQSSYYFYHIQVKNGMRDKLASFLRTNEIYTTFRYYPLHLVSFYGINEKFENAEYAAKCTLCIPLHQSLANDEVVYIINKIKEFGKKYM